MYLTIERTDQPFEPIFEHRQPSVPNRFGIYNCGHLRVRVLEIVVDDDVLIPADLSKLLTRGT